MRKSLLLLLTNSASNTVPTGANSFLTVDKSKEGLSFKFLKPDGNSDQGYKED